MNEITAPFKRPFNQALYDEMVDFLATWGRLNNHLTATQVVVYFLDGKISQILEREKDKYQDLAECLQEAIDLTEDSIAQNYHPDSFTTQPWKDALEAIGTDQKYCKCGTRIKQKQEVCEECL